MRNIKEKVYVISIIGKQSSGKSYLLNRIFQTRFSVAANRCTDGIWANLCLIQNHYFLVLDCEGLFSPSRSQKEEVQMLAFLTAISDMTLLNQDLSFNRYLTELLENLSSASEQLEGTTLFKGFLTIVLRDISSIDNSGIDEELQSNLNSQKYGDQQEVMFLVKLFNRRFFVEKLFNYENTGFDSQIISLRNHLIKLSHESNRWENGESLVSIIKIVLCQLEMSDKSNASLLESQSKIDLIVDQHKQKWLEKVGKIFEIRKKSLLFTKPSLEYRKSQSQIVIKQNYDLQSDNSIQSSEQLFHIMQEQLNLLKQTKYHNDNLQKIETFLKEQLGQCQLEITQSLEQELKQCYKTQETVEYIQNEIFKFKQFLSEKIESYTFCQEKCVHCHLKCNKYKTHSTQPQTELKQALMKIDELNQKKQTIQINILPEQIIKQKKQELNELEFQFNKTEEQFEIFIAQQKFKNEKDYQSQLQKDLNQIDEKLNQYFKQSQLQSMELEELKVYQSKVNFEIANKEEKIKIFIKELEQLESQQLLNKQNLNKNEENEATWNENIAKQSQDLEGLRNRLQICKIRAQNQNNQESFKNRENTNTFQLNSLQQIYQQITEARNHLQNWKNTTKYLRAQQSTEQFFKEFEQHNQILNGIEIRQIQLNEKMNLVNKDIRVYANQKQKLQEAKQDQQNIKIELDLLENQQSQHYYSEIEQIKKLLEKNQSKDEIKNQYIESKKQEEKDLEQTINDLEKEKDNLEQQIKTIIVTADTLAQIQMFYEKQVQVIEMQIALFKSKLAECKIQREKNYQSFQKDAGQIQFLQEEIKKLNKDILSYKSTIEVIQEIVLIVPKHSYILDQLQKCEEKLKNLEKCQISVNYAPEQIELECQKLCKIRRDQKEKIESLKQQIEEQNEIVEIESKLKNLHKQKKDLQLKKDQHSCQRQNHICDEQCCVCSGKQCKFVAGHLGQHLCEKQEHQCQIKCQVKGCHQKCSIQIGHIGNHVCQYLHQCQGICNFCNDPCEIDLQRIHQTHKCGATKCDKKCYLCDDSCKEQHSHSKENSNQHFCKKLEHKCSHKCQIPGICKIVYEQIEQTWQSEISTFKYINYVQQIARKQDCIQIIKANDSNHHSSHICFNETKIQFHSCDQRCPECLAFCTKQFGHDGEHSTHQHRNKEHQRFTLKIGTNEIIQIDQTRTYKVGDSAYPETCYESCKRRGRSHFHLIECKGGKQCLENNLEYKFFARHSNSKYQGFENINFDEILCLKFWQIQNWLHPIHNPRIQEEIQKCNFYCAICKNDSKEFCQEEAWHTNLDKYYNHTFPCIEKHKKNNLKGINICFVLDQTGSMKNYLDDSKEAIKQIMQKAKQFKNLDETEIPIQFAVVCYKDHERSDTTTPVYRAKDFSNYEVCLKFLNEIQADGGDDIPEAVLDGLHAAAYELCWNEEYFKILFLIAEAPPHGNNPQTTRVYHNEKDSFPNGCPCGKTQTPILKHIKKKNIQFKIIKINNSLNLTISEFQKDYTQLEVLDINQSIDYVPTIVNDVCKVLENNEITYKFQK